MTAAAKIFFDSKQWNCNQMSYFFWYYKMTFIKSIFVCLQGHKLTKAFKLRGWTDISEAQTQKTEGSINPLGSDSSCPCPAKGRRTWIKLIRRSIKSLSSQTGTAAALSKHLELENATCQVSSPLNPSAIVSSCVLSRPSNTTRGRASLPAIWLQYVLNITGYTLPASAHSVTIPFPC